MIRVLTQAALFLAPFVAYGIYLWMTRSGVIDRKSWPMPVVFWLTAMALLLMIGSFVLLAQFAGAPAGSQYTPAQLKDGQFVPGGSK